MIKIHPYLRIHSSAIHTLWYSLALAQVPDNNTSEPCFDIDEANDHYITNHVKAHHKIKQEDLGDDWAENYFVLAIHSFTLFVVEKVLIFDQDCRL